MLATPVITFRFTPGPLETFFFNSVTLYLDDADGVGGVSPPSSIDARVNVGPVINSPVGDQPGPSPFSVTLALGGVAGDTVEIRLNYLNEWIFLSEVSFEGAVLIRDDFGIPEPASIALLGIGLAGLRLGMRRRG